MPGWGNKNEPRGISGKDQRTQRSLPGAGGFVQSQGRKRLERRRSVSPRTELHRLES